MATIQLQGETEKKKGIYFEVDADAEPIGEGGTGKVYEGCCVNTKTGEKRPVAIKFMFADLDEQIIERARREANIQLRNDNLVEMLGFIETETMKGKTPQKHYHVVSELLHGATLEDIFNGRCTDAKGNEIPYAKKLLDTYTKDPDHFAKIIARNVLSGLMALHDAGYIHRDIDPSNIMITDDAHIKLIDFGICKQMNQLTTHDKVQTVAGAFMGKPEYAAPELALGDIKHQNQTTDIYAVGILIFQCILGHVPFSGKRIDILDKQVKQEIPLKGVKDARLRRIIKKACEKQAERRYQTAAEMRVDIESLDVKRANSHRQKHIAAGVVLLLLIVAVGAFLAVKSYKQAKETEQMELARQKTVDSLQIMFNNSLKLARQKAETGYMHDEEYDKDLIEAKKQYEKADGIARELSELDVTPERFSEEKQELDRELLNARDELRCKADLMQIDEDPEVRAEAKNITERIEELEKVINE